MPTFHYERYPRLPSWQEPHTGLPPTKLWLLVAFYLLVECCFSSISKRGSGTGIFGSFVSSCYVDDPRSSALAAGVFREPSCAVDRSLRCCWA